MAKWIKNLIMSFCLVGLAVISFAGCASNLSTFKDNPQKDDVVIGNGTLAVTKGDYLYFANGFVSYSEVSDNNFDGKITYSGLYRIKLENGHPVEVEPEKDEDGNEIFDGSNALENIDVLAKKVVGFEYVGLYILGDYLYYASPCNEKNGAMEVESSRVDFFRIKLDRSKSSEWIYTTKSAGSEVKYNAFESNGTTYITILDGKTLIATKYDAKNNKSSKVVSEEVTSVAFCSYNTSASAVADFSKTLYYTRDYKEGDGESFASGNVLCKFSLDKVENYDKVYISSDTITLKKASSEKIYYEKKISTNQSSSTSLYAVANESEIGTTKEEYVHSSYGDFMLVSSGNAMIVNDSTNKEIAVVDNNGNYTKIDSVTGTIIATSGNYVYYTDDSNNAIKRADFTKFANFKEGEETPTCETLVDSNVKTGSSNYVSVCGEKIFYLKNSEKESGHYYLNMIDVGSVDAETSKYYEHFVGVLETEDYDTQSE